MHRYQTHVGLTLKWTENEAHQQRVTITGDREKVLYEGLSRTEAEEVWAYTKEHYEQRRLALEIEGVAAEGKVPYVRKSQE